MMGNDINDPSFIAKVWKMNHDKNVARDTDDPEDFDDSFGKGLLYAIAIIMCIGAVSIFLT